MNIVHKTTVKRGDLDNPKTVSFIDDDTGQPWSPTPGNQVLAFLTAAATISIDDTGWTVAHSRVQDIGQYVFLLGSPTGGEASITFSHNGGRATFGVIIEVAGMGAVINAASTVSNLEISIFDHVQTPTIDLSGGTNSANAFAFYVTSDWDGGWETTPGDVPKLYAKGRDDQSIVTTDWVESQSGVDHMWGGVTLQTEVPLFTSYRGQGVIAKTSNDELYYGADSAIVIAFSDAAAPPAPGVRGENKRPYEFEQEWRIGDSGTANIQGFADKISYAPGETVNLKVHASVASYEVRWVRFGWYGGVGRAAIIDTTAGTPTLQPDVVDDPTYNSPSCAGWTVTDSWVIPATASPGLYVAVLTDLAGSASWLPFVVEGSGSEDVLVVLPDTTWQAYNTWGGPGANETDRMTKGRSIYGSFRDGEPNDATGRAFAVSYDRPWRTAGTHPQTFIENSDAPLIRFLERVGYDVAYTTVTQLDATPSMLLGHKTVIISGHNEYWSQAAMDGLAAARDAGVHIVVSSGNDLFWRIRYTLDRRLMICYKDTIDGPGAHVGGEPLDPVTWTGTWQDTRWPQRQPANELTGTTFIANGLRWDTIRVPDTYKDFPLWRDTTIPALGPGAYEDLHPGSLGFEWDKPDPPTGVTPVYGSSTTLNIDGYMSDANGEDYNLNGSATHQISLYRASSGALVFDLGTVQWSWGLDNVHVRNGAPYNQTSVTVQQATLNMLCDTGVNAYQALVERYGFTYPTAVSAAAYGITSSGTVFVNVGGTATQASGVYINAGGTATPIDGISFKP